MCAVVQRDSSGPGPPNARLGPEAAVRDTHRRMPDESTTPDLVELQRRLTAATNRGDADAVVAFYASDAVYDMSPVGMGVLTLRESRSVTLIFPGGTSGAT